MNKLMFALATGVLGLFAGMQLAPAPLRSNPDVTFDKTIEANLEMPPKVQAAVDRACKNCHSNQTQWPWYAKVAPVSWFLAKDVEHARKAVNFSEWTTGAGATRGKSMGTLMAICQGVKDGRMPPAPYQMMHPESKLNPEEVKAFCEWSTDSVRTLRSANVRLH